MTGARQVRHQPEQVAAAILVALALAALVGLIGWNWLFDSALLAISIYLAAVRTGRAAARASVVSVLTAYAVADAALQTLAGLLSPSWVILAFAALTWLFAAALARDLGERGWRVRDLPWRALFRGASAPITGGALAALVCLYLPMLRIHHADMMWTGPMVVGSGPVTVMNSGRTIDVGGTYIYRGVLVGFGRLTALLLAGTLAAQLMRLASAARDARLLHAMRAATAAVGCWWLFLAQGWRSPGEIFNLLFVVAWLVQAAAIFRASASGGGGHDSDGTAAGVITE